MTVGLQERPQRTVEQSTTSSGRQASRVSVCVTHTVIIVSPIVEQGAPLEASSGIEK